MDFVAVNNFGDTRSGGLAGPMGLFIILMMAIATVLLIRNMNKRLRRLPDSFDNVDQARADRAVADPTAAESDGGQDRDRRPSPSGEAEAQVSDVPTAPEPSSADEKSDRS